MYSLLSLTIVLCLDDARPYIGHALLAASAYLVNRGGLAVLLDKFSEVRIQLGLPGVDLRESALITLLRTGFVIVEPHQI